MFHLIVRARKDAKAVQYINERNYGGFLKVSSLGGGRALGEIENALEEHLQDPYIPIILFGEREKELVDGILPILNEGERPFYVRSLRTKAVRNMRVDELYENIEEIKARFRLGFEWVDSPKGYRINPLNPMGLEVHPDYDVYVGIGEGFRESLKTILGVETGLNPLILRKLMNQEVYYSGPFKVAEISKRLGVPTEVLWRIPGGEDVSIERLVELNRSYIEAFEKASKKFLQAFEGYDIIVPWSGGKDSTAALILAKEVFEKVTAIYVRMEYEMPMTEEYVEKTAKRLGIELIKVDVPMPVEKFGMPTHKNRWCTKMKVEALYREASNFENPILIVGDRDGESARRRVKPPVVRRKSEVLGEFLEVMPIKFWSGFMAQLYILMKGIELHPLYGMGFYRLGCTICPSLSDWEIKLLDFMGV